MSSPAEAPTLTVVVPVHNAAPWLRQSLDSLLAQTGVDLEVVCVEDGSTDGSDSLLDAYAAVHPNVRALHLDSGGPGRARNVGVAVASGELLAFADADDMVPPGAYARMFACMRETGSDIVVGNVLRFTPDRTWQSGLHQRAVLAAARATHITRMPSLLYDATMWNKLYRRGLWDEHEIRFPENSTYEDIVPALKSHLVAHAVDVLDEPVYLWRFHHDGVLSRSSRRMQLKALEDRFAALDEVDKRLAEHGFEQLRVELQVRVLDMDLPLFLTALPQAAPEVRRRFREILRDRLAAASPEALARVRFYERVVYGLGRRGLIRPAIRLYLSRHRARRVAGPPWRVARRAVGLVRGVPARR